MMYTEDMCGELWYCNKMYIYTYVCIVCVSVLLDIDQVEILRKVKIRTRLASDYSIIQLHSQIPVYLLVLVINFM
jgi:hypothetical protein